MRRQWGFLVCLALLAVGCTDIESPSPGATSQNSFGDRLLQGFSTQGPLQARSLAGSSVDLRALLTVGDQVGGVEWAPIPDGLGGYREVDQVVLFANHELTPDDAYPGYEYARVSRIVINPDLSIAEVTYPVDGSEQLERLCSATFVGLFEGFPSGLFLTGEEIDEGRTFALDRQGVLHPLLGQGRYAKENTIAVPGFAGRVVLLGLDDSRGKSELYLYVAADEQAVLADQGTLYVFATDALRNVGQLAEGQTIHGVFRPVPSATALGTGADLQTWVNERRWVGLTPPAVQDGPPIFPFVRIEDGDYDRSKHTGVPAVYFVDTGTDQSSGTSATCGTAADQLCDPYGSIYRLELDPSDPTANARLTLLARSQGHEWGWASPDNVATSQLSLMVQEDPAYDAFDRPARIYQFRVLGNGGLSHGRAIVELVEDADGCGPGADCWESSGIIDASAWFGPGAWLFDVQAHGLENIPGIPDGGQLIFMRVPGS